MACRVLLSNGAGLDLGFVAAGARRTNRAKTCFERAHGWSRCCGRINDSDELETINQASAIDGDGLQPFEKPWTTQPPSLQIDFVSPIGFQDKVA